MYSQSYLYLTHSIKSRVITRFQSTYVVYSHYVFLDAPISLFCILTCATIYVLIHHIILALSLFLKYNLLFSSTPVPTSSIDVISILSIRLGSLWHIFMRYKNFKMSFHRFLTASLASISYNSLRPPSPRPNMRDDLLGISGGKCVTNCLRVN